jgi:cyclophilin family peptidyl-prolyl cis-trans isomerase
VNGDIKAIPNRAGSYARFKEFFMMRLSLSLCCLFGGFVTLTTPAAAETVRFETNIGGFNVVLNPTNNPNLQPLVDNFLQYVESGRYVGAVINRAVTDFVVQMGGYRTDNYAISTLTTGGLPEVAMYPPVIVDANNDGTIDFDTTGLSNTRGEVALALNASGPNSGTGNFYVNLSDNSFLDQQGFLPFARITDLTFMDQLTSGQRIDLSVQAGAPGSLAYTDVPVVGGSQFVVFESVYVVPEPASGVAYAGAFLVTVLGRRPRR